MYWPFFVLIFYVLCPIPHFIAKRVSDDGDSGSNVYRELAYFLTSGIVVSAFGLPMVLAHVSVVCLISPYFYFSFKKTSIFLLQKLFSVKVTPLAVKSSEDEGPGEHKCLENVDYFIVIYFGWKCFQDVCLTGDSGVSESV